MDNPNVFPVWDENHPVESLNAAYDWAVRVADDYIKWYEKFRTRKKMASIILRGLSIIFVAVGTLCPLLEPIVPFGKTINLGQWGYVCFALAATFIGYDKFFGLSTSWMRFTITWMDLKRSLKEFQCNWAIMLVNEQENNSGRIVKLLEIIKSFSLEMDEHVQKETQVWISEFQKSLAELDKQVRQRMELKEK